MNLLRKCLCRLAFIMISFSFVSTANAGSIEIGERYGQFLEESLMGRPNCELRFSGEIVQGDSLLLQRETGDSMGFKNICMNSSGGSFEEALQMNSTQKHMTVLPGDVCESACALAFMGGGFYTGNGVPSWVPSRSIWPGARLGFHAPSLNLPESGFVAAEQVQKTFALALDVASQVLELTRYTHDSPFISMNDYLFMRFLSTPSDSMYYIETVGDALFSGIQVQGVDYGARSNEEVALSACINAYLLNTNREDSRPWGGRRDALATASYNYDFFENLHERNGLKPTVVEMAMPRPNEVFALVGPFANLRASFIQENYCLLSFDPASLADSTDVNWFDKRRGVEVRWWWRYGIDPLPELMDIVEDKADGGGFSSDPVSLDPLIIFDFRTLISDLPNSPFLLRWKKENPDWQTAERSDAPAFTLLVGYDIFGSDIASVADVQQPYQCQKLCGETQGCDVATYNRWHNMCFLKSISGPVQATAHFTSDLLVAPGQSELVTISNAPEKVTLLENYVVTGGITDRMPANDAQSCQSKCLGSRTCRAFSFQPENETCQLYSQPDGISNDDRFNPEGKIVGLVEQ